MDFKKISMFILVCVFVLMSATVSTATTGGPHVIYDGELSLTGGTFDFVPSNNASAGYEIDNFTDLGALYAASLDGDFGFNATDDYYSLYGSFSLKNITDVESSWSGGPTWFIFINGESASLGLGANQIENGDTVTLWYCPYNSATYEPITEEATYVVNISVAADIIYDEELSLTGGTFDFVPSNNASASYPVDNFTDLGALYAASLDGDFGFNATDDYYSLYESFSLKNITDVESSWSCGPTWFIFINGESASLGLGANQIENGDTVTFWYCPYNSATYEPITEEATYVVNISVAADIIYDEELSLTGGTFAFVPSNNASASYPVDNFTDLGALYAASLDGGFGFNATDDYYSLYESFSLKNITDVESSWSGGPTWFIFINGKSATSGLGTNGIEIGDTVTFWYCPYNSTTYEPITEEATYVANIRWLPTLSMPGN
jgi:hypothetical protein